MASVDLRQCELVLSQVKLFIASTSTCVPVCAPAYYRDERAASFCLLSIRTTYSYPGVVASFMFVSVLFAKRVYRTLFFLPGSSLLAWEAAAFRVSFCRARRLFHAVVLNLLNSGVFASLYCVIYSCFLISGGQLQQSTSNYYSDILTRKEALIRE